MVVIWLLFNMILEYYELINREYCYIICLKNDCLMV